MHILTKVFVVLVSLLAVAIVPLAAVQTSNQASLRQQIKDKETAAAAARGELDTERALRAKSENDTALQIKDLDADKIRLQSEIAQKDARTKSLEAELMQAKARLTNLEQTVQNMTTADLAKTELTRTLREESESQRKLATDCEKFRLDIEQKLGKSESDLQVAQEALADLKEHVAALSQEKAKSDQLVAQYSSRHGALDQNGAGADAAAAPADRNLTAKVINVDKSGDATLAEIDAGSRDGVRVGWVLTIADKSRFIGKLRITTVDLNKSVGTVELVDEATRGPVKVGQRVTARQGQ